MKDFLDLLKDYALKFGIPEKYLDIIAIAIIIITVLGFGYAILSVLWKGLSSLVLWRNQRVLNKDLRDFFMPIDVERATRYYISTQYQNVSPSEDEEPGRRYIAAAKNKLIPLFLQKAFLHGKDNNKYYLILADTGMGKTTFLINLYISYKNQWNFFNKPRPEIKLIPLGSPDALAAIQLIGNPQNTILLLDAFDEDVKALHHYKSRMEEILAVVKDFHEIVITCRTQFFPSQKEEPYETGHITFGESGEYKFQKLYISVFQDKDIKDYINKRFPIYQQSNRRKARRITKKSPNLVMRPMLLSHIEDLLDRPNEYEFSFEIYEQMVKKWIEREAKKAGIVEKYRNIEKYKALLKAFSQQLAVDMYKNRVERNGYFIGKAEEYGRQIAEIVEGSSNPEMDETDRRSRSMLNRDAEGKYKFAHKSIMEYFLVKEMLEKLEFSLHFDFTGMEAATLFMKEAKVMALRQMKGFFYLENNKKLALSTLTIETIDKIEKIVINTVENQHFYFLKDLQHIKQIVIKDNQRYPILYDIYIICWSCLRLERLKPQELQELQGWLELHKLRELLEWQELREQYELLELLEQHELLNLLKQQEMRNLRENEQLEQIKRLERLKLQELLMQLIFQFHSQAPETLQELKGIEQFLKDMKELKKHLPADCVFIY